MILIILGVGVWFLIAGVVVVCATIDGANGGRSVKMYREDQDHERK